MARNIEKFGDLPCFWGHQQAPEGLSFRNPREEGDTERPRRQGVASTRSSAVTTSARVGPGAGFKKCCMRSGNFDGVDRDYYARW